MLSIAVDAGVVPLRNIFCSPLAVAVETVQSVPNVIFLIWALAAAGFNIVRVGAARICTGKSHSQDTLKAREAPTGDERRSSPVNTPAFWAGFVSALNVLA